MKPLLLISVGRALAALPSGGREEDVEVRRIETVPVATTLDPDRPTVIVLDRRLLATAGNDILAALAAVAALAGHGEPGEAEPPTEYPIELLSTFIPGGATARTTLTHLHGAFRHAAALVAARSAGRNEELRRRDLAELTRVGVALATERDLRALLEMILSQARRLSSSDAASLYLVERDDDGKAQRLHFMLAQNFSLPDLPFNEFTVPIDRASLAGYAAESHAPLVIEDVYNLPPEAEYRQNRSFDERFGYRTKSMLVIPMTTHRDEVVGVLQLMNRKRSPDVRLVSPEVVDQEVVGFDTASVELVSALAAQAGVAIENSQLYAEIEKLFEGFVTAAVTAIESRDPTTFGHSGRVATLSVGLAEAVERGGTGAYSSLRFTRSQLRELRYAGLLHDFGKVGVREQVLVKEKKLYPGDLELIRRRFAFLSQQAEVDFERTRADYLLRCGREGYDAVVAQQQRVREERQGELDRFFNAIVTANQPSLLPEGTFEELRTMNQRQFHDIDGSERPILSTEEIRMLSIRKGNLDEAERREIESHVVHTFRFLQQIPWTRELKHIPEIAYGHHEKLNGRGYPRAVVAAAIPVQTRMMTIADIFDALTASDRPYKPAVALPRALDILHMEAKDGQLDRELLDTFIEARVFELVAKDRPSGAH